MGIGIQNCEICCLFFFISLLEDNLALPPLIICKYVWLMYLESCLGPVNNINIVSIIMLIIIIIITRVALKHIAYILSVYSYLLLDILFNFWKSIIVQGRFLSYLSFYKLGLKSFLWIYQKAAKVSYFMFRCLSFLASFFSFFF